MVWRCAICIKDKQKDNEKDTKKDSEAMSPTVDTKPPTAGLSESVTPRAEYPRPILVRDQWQSLNGHWLF